MRVLLTHPSDDFVFDPRQPPIDGGDIYGDLDLDQIALAMGGNDAFVYGVCRTLLLAAIHGDEAAVAHRQPALGDALRQAQLVRELYLLATNACEERRKYFIGTYHLIPSSVLYNARQGLTMFVGALRRLRQLACAESVLFESSAFVRFQDMLEEQLGDAYLHEVEHQVAALSFDRGVLMSARLGLHNEGVDYVLRQSPSDLQPWFERLATPRSRQYTYRLADRDEAGGRMLNELSDRGVNLVANALAQSSDHILAFFTALRSQLAFYVGVINLHRALVEIGAPSSVPDAQPSGRLAFSATALYDVALALRTGRPPVGNDIRAAGKDTIVVTGANQGGKSTWLRAVGQAHVMMQCGLEVGARALVAGIASGVHTHFRREEDAAGEHGKLDEELSRLSQIVDLLRRDALVLFNESFASTNAREGAELAFQVTTALRDSGVRVCFVTHLGEFAQRLLDTDPARTLALRAERREDGTRTFKLREGAPLETSYAEDVYAEVFD